MADYYNARDLLPVELVAEVIKHIPEVSRTGATLYFSEDYYAVRNLEITRCFRIYQSDPSFGSHLEIYEALSEQFGLTVRRICDIVREARGGRRTGPARRSSGVRVARSSRRMRVRAAPCREAGAVAAKDPAMGET